MSVETLVEPHYRALSGRHTVDGVTFISYSTGVLRYTRISEDGRYEVRSAGGNGNTYIARSVLSGGWIKSSSGKPKRFRGFQSAARAAIAATPPRSEA